MSKKKNHSSGKGAAPAAKPETPKDNAPEMLNAETPETAAPAPEAAAPEAKPAREKAPEVPRTESASTAAASRSAAVKRAGASKNGEKYEYRIPADRDKFALAFDNVLFAAALMFSMFFMEIVIRMATVGTLGGRFFVYASFAAFAAGAIVALICTFFPPRVNYALTVVIMWFLAIYFGVQLIYVKFFKDFFYWDLLGMAGNITQFWRETLAKVGQNIVPLMLLFLPAILFTVIGAFKKPRKFSWFARAGAVVVAAVLIVSANAFIRTHNEAFDDAYYYGEGFSASESATRFGILTTLRLDTQYTLFGKPDEGEIPDNPTTLPELPTLPINPPETFEPETTAKPVEVITDPVDQKTYISVDGQKYELITEPDGKMWIDYLNADGSTERREIVKDEAGNYVLYIPPKPIDTSPNVLNIDWDALIANAPTTAIKNAHKYFSTREPTNKNAYTGMFAGKNVIFVTVEAWANAAIDPVLTPTLYKMKTQGFVFENYYSSMWGGSTATGEYANITGNFYRSASCLKNVEFSKTYQKFTLANMLNKEGYVSLGFHNNDYTYYNRDKSHANFGYQWFGVGNWPGANFSGAWPESDRLLGENLLASLPTDGTPFNLYLMTVSGHAYQAGSNAQAKKHYMDVLNANLDSKYPSENALKYIASQYEVELMVNVICDYLAEKDLLKDTVFVMATDHIPYEIHPEESETVKILSILSGLPEEKIFVNPELYHETLIIWTPDMKPVTVKKVCSAIDILPTMLNLLGLDYDSRLLTGHDILSDTPGFVPLNMSNASGAGSSNNFFTDYGYFSNSGAFTPAAGVEISDEDAKSIFNYYKTVLTNYNKYSPFILDNDYYGIVFPNEKKN